MEEEEDVVGVGERRRRSTSLSKREERWPVPEKVWAGASRRGDWEPPAGGSEASGPRGERGSFTASGLLRRSRLIGGSQNWRTVQLLGQHKDIHRQHRRDGRNNRLVEL